MSIMAGLFGVWWLAAVILLLGSAGLALAGRWTRGRHPLAGSGQRWATLETVPPVSIIVPLRDELEIENDANAALAKLDDPACEILFCVRSGRARQGADLTCQANGMGPGEGRGGVETLEAEPLLVGARQADLTPSDLAAPVAAHTQCARLPRFAEKARLALIRTPPRQGWNPKLANLVEPIAVAANDLILVKDAGTVLSPDVIRAMAAALGPGVGLVSAVPVARRPDGMLAHVEAALINTYGARMLLALAALGGGAGIGAAMLFRRSDLEAAGGLQAISAAIADDNALARLLAGRGLRSAFAGTVDQNLGLRGLEAIWRRHLRWAICRRLEAPLAFAAEPLLGMLAAYGAAVGLVGGFHLPPWPMLVGTILLWPITECCLAARKGWPLSWHTPFAIVLREFAMPVLWLHAWSRWHIEWGATSVSIFTRRWP